MSRNIWIGIGLAMIVVVGLSLYILSQSHWRTEIDPPVPPAGVQIGIVGIANPASSNCVELGGRLEILTDGEGGQVGYCHMKDGRVCEEWALFRDGSCVAPN